MRFGEFLVSQGLASAKDVAEAITAQRYVKKPIGRLLCEQGYISAENLDKALRQFKQNGAVSSDEILRDISNGGKNEGLSGFLDSSEFILISFNDFEARILSKRYCDRLCEQIEQKFGCWVNFEIVGSEVYDFIHSTVFVGSPRIAKRELTIRESLSDSEKLEGPDAYTKLFRDCILEAQRKGASDIHIEPDDNGLRIRFRIMGDCALWKELDRPHKQPFINAVKKLSNLPIAICGIPKDSRISLKNLDIRVNSLPTVEGEKIVLRLLDKSRSFELEQGGFNEIIIDAFSKAIEYRNGLVLLSGATGSGKTSTLYSLLNRLDKATKNIVTIEDPVEYTFRGIHQVSVNEKVSFHDALRAILRQDPDVILVGEIRDQETAELAFHAAATGHLVFSTVHANTASNAIGRLEHIGVDSQTIRENLRYSFSQMLVKQLCEKCSIASNDGTRIASSGCESCDNGYFGRRPIIEFMNEFQIERYMTDRSDVMYGMSFHDAVSAEVLAGRIDARWAQIGKERKSA